jgi:hypothetical protein
MGKLGVAYGWSCALDSLKPGKKCLDKCFDECGIVEVVTISLRDFESLVKLAGIRKEDIVPESVGPLVWHDQK